MKRVGIFGKEGDLQTKRVAEILRQKGAEVLFIPLDSFERGIPHAMEGENFYFNGVDLREVKSFWLRYIQAPLAPAIEKDGELYLHQDWYIIYMQKRERESYVLSWLLSMDQQNVTIINPPVAGHVYQLKPFQLYTFIKNKLPVPKTLITNDPDKVRQFKKAVGEVIFKPSMGGGYCQVLTPEQEEKLDLIVNSPIIFQERVRGEDLRVIVLDDEIVSSVIIEVPPDTVDFRTDPTYSSGKITYRELELPREVREVCIKAAKLCGLRFAGIDIKWNSPENYRLLECNSSPIYLDVELKMGHPISERLADKLLEAA